MTCKPVTAAREKEAFLEFDLPTVLNTTARQEPHNMQRLRLTSKMSLDSHLTPLCWLNRFERRLTMANLHTEKDSCSVDGVMRAESAESDQS